MAEVEGLVFDERSDADRPRRLSTAYVGNLAGFTFAAVGYITTSFVLYWGFSTGRFAFPGADALIWDRVGDEVRNGLSPYYTVPGTGGFYYGPPWALAFAAVSWLPVQLVALALIALEGASLWYIAGSWKRLGWCLLLPYVAWELPSSQTNLILAAAIAAALRGDPRAAVVGAFAKLSPIFAISPYAWRRAATVALVLVAVTVPWITLWPDWIRLLADTATATAPIASTQLPLSLLPRLVLAGFILLLVRQPWGRGLAAVVAIPAPYLVSLVLFLGLLPPHRRSAAPAGP